MSPQPIDKATMEAHPSVVYGLDAQLRLTYVNPMWSKFALDNGASEAFLERWRVGASLEDALDGPVREFYREQLLGLLGSETHWEHDYECSTPGIYRKFRMAVYPQLEEPRLVVVNSLTVERPHANRDRPPHEFDPRSYVDDEGVVQACSNCRRTLNQLHPQRWDWVPSLVRHPRPPTSHGACPVCANYYWGV